jgi:DNA-binding winged helix-turn-helix (wHTH) protein/Tol biopolymer transport system component
VASALAYEFGPFTVQPAERLLVRGGRPVSLTPKAFDLLTHLVDRPGQLVGKQELMAALWPDTFVEEANLAYTMSALRKALGDGQSGDLYIQTVPTRGYRFIAPVVRRAPASSDPALVAPTIRNLPQRFSVMLLAAAVLVAVGALAILQWAPSRSAPTRPPLRLSVELGVDATLPLTDAAFTLSADGTMLAFAARTSGNTPQLYLRRLEQLTATPLPGTDGASSPFFSPDGQWLAFFADSKLKKVRVTGGAVVTLADARNPRGGWWAEDGTIVFAPTPRVGLMRVSDAGGDPKLLTTLVADEISHRFPQVLPGGRAVLYTASTEVNIGAGTTLVVQPLPSGERIVIRPGGFFGRYAASGHVVFIEGNTLFAMPFDSRRLKQTGPAARVIDGVKSDGSRGSAQVAVSPAGVLAYLPGQNLFAAGPVAWMDRNGTLSTLRAVPVDWSNPEFSPDGRRIAMDIRREGHSDIWVYDVARDAPTRVTSDTTNEESPVWTPDGRGIVYRSFGSSISPAGHTLSWKRADGAGDAQVLVKSNAPLMPGSWHPTRNMLAYVAETTTTAEDVMILPVDGDETNGWKPGHATAFVNSAARERGPVFSPDGRWLAYQSTEAGPGRDRDEVYVRPFPGPGERVTVSSAGGETPSWSRMRPELVFTTPGPDYRRVLMVAPYRVENNSFRPDKPLPWAKLGVALRILNGQRNYALHPDGVRVAIAPPPEGEDVGQTHVTLVFNFFDELRRIAPAKP